MKRFLVFLLAFFILCVFSACAPDETFDNTNEETSVSASWEKAETTSEEVTIKDMKKIKVIVGESEFTATLYDNECARDFSNMLPLTLDMSDLHSNEKYYYLNTSLPVLSNNTDNIYEGDIKLFQDNCLVLFYDDFSNSYSYTDIGKIDDADGLKQALGNGNITITFE